MEDTDIDEEVFDAAVCPECTKMTEHEVLRRNAKGNGEDLLVGCVICSNVHNLQLRPPKSVFIKTTLSDRMDSELSLIEADEDEEIVKEDYFQHQEQTYRITRIEDSTSRECISLNAGEISAMWAVRVDRTIVPITMTEGEISVPRREITVTSEGQQLEALGRLSDSSQKVSPTSRLTLTVY